MRGFDHFADLHGRPGRNFRIGIGRCARRIAGMTEDVCGAPEQPDAGALHVPREYVDNASQVRLVLPRGRRVGHGVHVMETEERCAEFLEEAEGVLGFQFSELLGRRRPGFPGSIKGAGAKYVMARPRETVPIARGDAQMLRHGLSDYDAIFLVILERQRIY